MKPHQSLAKLFYDWMGVLLAVVLLFLGLTGQWAPSEWPQTNAQSVLSKTDGTDALLIVVDAGHGGKDNGAEGKNGVKEAGLNLKVAKLVEGGLREAGFAVKMTRTDKNSLGDNKRKDMQARREIMREDGVAAVVSIHMNKFSDSSISGPMVFYMKGSEKGQALAEAVIEAVCLKLDHAKRPANPGDYFVLRESIAPAAIVECGFLSNSSDEAKLVQPEYQQKLAEGIVSGLAKYFAPKS